MISTMRKIKVRQGLFQAFDDSRRKFAFTARLAGLSAALIDSSAATPLNSDGVRPERSSGQHRDDDCRKDICAAIAPSAIAAVFSFTARALSVPQGWLLPASIAINGRRIIATIGANIRSAPM